MSNDRPAKPMMARARSCYKDSRSFRESTPRYVLICVFCSARGLTLQLYDRYLAKCGENMRLTSELKNAKPGDGDVMANFNETVEPVILEYEKVVGALNKQLDELRAELVRSE